MTIFATNTGHTSQTALQVERMNEEGAGDQRRKRGKGLRQESKAEESAEGLLVAGATIPALEFKAPGLGGSVTVLWENREL